jgi:acyl-CoA reductase-like NAD-dependent aldehyde dehydrogenase
LDEDVTVANNSEYGLSVGIVTRDEEEGLAIAHPIDKAPAREGLLP